MSFNHNTNNQPNETLSIIITIVLVLVVYYFMTTGGGGQSGWNASTGTTNTATASGMSSLWFAEVWLGSWLRFCGLATTVRRNTTNYPFYYL